MVFTVDKLVEHIHGYIRRICFVSVDILQCLLFYTAEFFLVPSGLEQYFTDQSQYFREFGCQGVSPNGYVLCACINGYIRAQVINSFFKFHRSLVFRSFHHQLAYKVSGSGFIQRV